VLVRPCRSLDAVNVVRVSGDNGTNEGKRR
jgi:hypothetical protein